MKSALILIPFVLFASCNREKNAFAPPPPTPVGVEMPIVRDQQTYGEFPGRIEALQRIEIRARATGILEGVTDAFQPGDIVKKDTILFQIDDLPYVLAVNSAKANLAKAEASQRIAEVTLERRKKAGRAISEIDVEAAQADLEASAAEVMSAKAALNNAEENLSYCTIKSPITGRISELQVDQFNLVSAEQSTLLCTIVQDDSMHVYFEANERSALKFLERRQQLENDNVTPPSATLTLADGSVYPHPAQIELADNRLDEDTGTLLIRAVVPNAKGQLADGLFVRVTVPKDDQKGDSILIPTIAIQQDLGGFFVLTVDEDSKVLRKNVKLADRVDRLRIVSSGLTGEEKVITVGLQRVREGMPVTIQPNNPKSPEEAEAKAE